MHVPKNMLLHIKNQTRRSRNRKSETNLKKLFNKVRKLF